MTDTAATDLVEQARVAFDRAQAQRQGLPRFRLARPGAGLQPGKEVGSKGGHVSLVAGGNAVRRLWPNLDGWLQERLL